MIDSPVVVTAGLTKVFKDVVAVDALDLSIARGATFGLLGSNGAGKTTTVKLLTTLLAPSSGTASVAGFDVVARPREVRRRIGYVPQMVSVDATLTGRENLTLFARLYALPRAERADRVSEALAFMGLSGVADALVKTYSGGMVRRLELAHAMLHRPDVLFLDEPTVGLDPVARQAVWDRLRELGARFGSAILLTTHDMEEAESLCDRVAVMHRGRVVVSGAPRDLKDSVGEGASMSDVFAHYTGGEMEAGGNLRDVARTRRTAKRLG